MRNDSLLEPRVAVRGTAGGFSRASTQHTRSINTKCVSAVSSDKMRNFDSNTADRAHAAN